MNIKYGIIMAVIGLIFAVLSLTGIAPGITGTGVTLLLVGALLIGLSFIKKPDDEGTAKMSTLETLTAIFYSPSEVFANLRRHPRWFAAILAITIVSGVYTNLFFYKLTAERITNYTIDKTLEMPMIANNEDARRGVEESRKKTIEDSKNPIYRTGEVFGSFARYVVWFAFLGAIILLAAMMMGGKINFWQAFSIASYAALPILVVRYLLSTIILFIKDPTDIHPIIGQASLVQDSLDFLVNPAENPVLFTLLGFISLFSIYWIFMHYVGLKNGGEKISSPTAWTITLALFVLGLIGTLGMAFMFPSFIS